jgi:hypothetical protein
MALKTHHVEADAEQSIHSVPTCAVECVQRRGR